jgi:hypothetical protein
MGSGMCMFRFRDADFERAFYREVFGLEWGPMAPNATSTGPASKPSVGISGPWAERSFRCLPSERVGRLSPLGETNRPGSRGPTCCDTWR